MTETTGRGWAKLEDEELEVLGFAPFGDPIEIRFGNSRLSLRKAEAANIAVQIV